MAANTKASVSRLRIGFLLFAALLMYVLVSQLSNFKGSLSELRTSRLADEGAVLIAVGVTYLMSSLTYWLIAFRPIRYMRTVVIEIAVNTLNRLLPAGIGGIGANYVYLRRNKHSGPRAAAVVAVNAFIGIAANLLLLAVVVSFFGISKLKFNTLNARLILAGGLLLASATTVLVIVPSWRKWIGHGIREVLGSIKLYRSRKRRLFYALVSQMALCLAYVLAVDYSLKAVGVHLPIGSVMVAYSFAIWLGAAIPAPGGVGSVETGLVAALVAFNVDLTHAVAAVLIFRLLSFWLPLVLGIGPLIWSFKKGYL